MSRKIKICIEDQARKNIREYHRVIDSGRRENEDRCRRTAQNGTPPAIKAIASWSLDQQFNPFYVRSKAACISHAIEAAIKTGSYKPRPSIDVRIPKRGGGHRSVSVFTIPDGALGNWLFRRLYARNQARLSDYAFAYRPDKNIDAAIAHVATAVRALPRPYVVECDFDHFFDSVDHSYLGAMLDRHFVVTDVEKRVIQAILAGRSASEINYNKKTFKVRKVGIPQGNTISLFLANAVCIELDRGLEKLPVTFARYADDLVAVTRSYSDACEATGLIYRWAAVSGIRINERKSEGISLLSTQATNEIKSKRSIVFLGCEIAKSGVSPAEERIKRFKNKIALVVYQHLIQAPKNYAFNPSRIRSGVDYDLLECVKHLRRLFYGRLSEADITAGLKRRHPQKPIRSHLSGFSTVDIPDLFRELDGWIVGILERAYAMRASLVSKLGATPLALNRKALITGSWCSNAARDAKLPSAFRAWLYMRMTYKSKHFSARGDL